MTTTSSYFVGGIFVGLLLLLGWYEVTWRWRVIRAKPLGSLDWLTEPARQPPGYCVHNVISVVGSTVYNRFTVSVSAPVGWNFRVRVRIPPGIRLTALQTMSDATAERALERYFKSEHSSCPPWRREVAEEVAVKLSRLGPCHGAATLEARGGRLVYSWTRIQDAVQHESRVLAEIAEAELAEVVALLERE